MSIVAYKEKDGTINLQLTGTVSRDPEYKETKSGKTKVRFSIAYGKKKYMNCEVWEDRAASDIAARLEKGDTILVAGTHSSWERDGKQYEVLDLELILPMSLPVAAPAPDSSGKPRMPDERDKAASSEWDEEDDSELPFK